MMPAILASNLRLDRTAAMRWLGGGIAWGLALAAGFVGMAAWQCGVPCPEDVAFTTLACVGTGLLTIGPFAAFAAPR